QSRRLGLAFPSRSPSLRPLVRPGSDVFRRLATARAKDATLVSKTKADNAPKGLHSVFPGDFLAFLVSATSVGDRHFVYAPVSFCYFRSNFRFETEAIRFEGNSLQDFASENLVAGLHVGKLQVGENVRK